MDAVKDVATKHLMDNNDVLVCPAESLIQSLTKNFGSYKKSVSEFVEVLSEGGDSKEDIGEKADMALLKTEQDEFARQITGLRKILNAQKLGEEDHSHCC